MSTTQKPFPAKAFADGLEITACAAAALSMIIPSSTQNWVL